MARRVTGDLLVARRPDGGAVLAIRSSTGEAIEIERTAIQVSELVSALSPKSPPPEEHAAIRQPVTVKQSARAAKSKEDNTNA